MLISRASFLFYIKYLTEAWGTLLVVQLVEALRKSEGRGFDSRWCYWNLLLTQSFRLHSALGLTQPLTEMSTRNISWEVKAAGV
jgi:hypothetical protein